MIYVSGFEKRGNLEQKVIFELCGPLHLSQQGLYNISFKMEILGPSLGPNYFTKCIDTHKKCKNLTSSTVKSTFAQSYPFSQILSHIIFDRDLQEHLAYKAYKDHLA